MRIVVISHNLRVAGGLSVGQNLTAMLPCVAPCHKYLMIIPAGCEYPVQKNRNISVLEIDFMGLFNRLVFETRDLKKAVSEFHPDIILALGNYGLKNPPAPQAILFHKPQLVYPKKYYRRETWRNRFKNWLLKRKIKRMLTNTPLVFCQTQVIRRRFSETFNYPLKQIEIAANAVSEFAKSEGGQVEIPDLFKEKDCYNLFFLAKFYAHKNIEILLEIFRKYADCLQNVRCIITVSSEQHPNASRFFRKVEKYKLQKQIVNVGPLRQEELVSYFTHADALFFPTLLESFSGTYLEAMHFGLPILTSDLDFARYICGDAALYFNPWCPQDIVDKIKCLKDDFGLKEKLVMNGKKRMFSFFESWEDITKHILEKLESLCQ